MRYKTHIVTSVTLAAGVSKLFSIPFTIGYVAGVTVGSLLPDIDEPNSYIGRRSFGIARLVKKVFGHRGFTHSLLCWFTLTVCCFIFPSLFTAGISLGYFFHIVEDLFSVQGVPLFSPIQKNRQRLPVFMTYRTSSATEFFILLFSLFMMFFMILDEHLVKEFMRSIAKLGNVILDFFIEAMNNS